MGIHGNSWLTTMKPMGIHGKPHGFSNEISRSAIPSAGNAAQGPTRMVLMTTATMIKPRNDESWLPVMWKLAKVCVKPSCIHYVHLRTVYTASPINSICKSAQPSWLPDSKKTHTIPSLHYSLAIVLYQFINITGRQVYLKVQIKRRRTGSNIEFQLSADIRQGEVKSQTQQVATDKIHQNSNIY